MRALLFSMLGLFTAALSACSPDVILETSGGTLGSGGAPSSVSSSIGAGASETTTTTTSTSTYISPPSSWPGCAGPDLGLPPSSCTPSDPACSSHSVCLATADNNGAAVFGLRMSQLTLTRPGGLASGIGASVLEGWMTPQNPTCNLNGAGLFSWLLRLDPVGGTITTGGAVLPADPVAGYDFLSGTVSAGPNTATFAPVTLPATFAPGCGFDTGAADLVLPVMVTESQLFWLPLRQVRFHDGVVSADHNCIGAYDVQGLAESGCHPQSGVGFGDGAQVDGFMTLEDADVIDINQLPVSLCAFLSGSSDSNEQGNGFAHCKRDPDNQIIAKGDWCSVTNQPATPGCADSYQFSGSFAASAVRIN